MGGSFPGFRPESLIGERAFGGRIVQLIASGGIGHVYMARPDDDSEPYAIKLLRPELVGKATHMSRFEREALAASRVHHENVLRVDGAVRSVSLPGTAAPHRFFTMELLRGMDLADTIAHQKPIAPARVARIVRGAARGLGAAHAAGVVHRDVKPENVFLVHALDGREIVKMIDFGSAWVSGDAPPKLKRITLQSVDVGTPEYTPPEQMDLAEGKATGDVYSLGIVFYELLAGAVPFRGTSWHEVLKMHLSQPPPVLSFVSPEMWSVLATMLAKDPKDRFPSMDLVEEAVSRTPEGS